MQKRCDVSLVRQTFFGRKLVGNRWIPWAQPNAD